MRAGGNSRREGAEDAAREHRTSNAEHRTLNGAAVSSRRRLRSGARKAAEEACREAQRSKVKAQNKSQGPSSKLQGLRVVEGLELGNWRFF